MVAIVFALKFAVSVLTWIYLGQLGYKLSTLLREPRSTPHHNAGCEIWEKWHQENDTEERVNEITLKCLGPISLTMVVGLWVITETVKSAWRAGSLLYKTLRRQNRLSVF